MKLSPCKYFDIETPVRMNPVTFENTVNQVMRSAIMIEKRKKNVNYKQMLVRQIRAGANPQLYVQSDIQR